MSTSTVTASTPVLFVDRIEPCLAFWQGLGFSQTASVPEGDHLGFVILSNSKVELMYQTFDSLARDVPAALEAARAGKTFLFLHVDDLATVRRAVEGSPVYVPERKTFYGSLEIGVREPGGHYVLFAQMDH